MIAAAVITIVIWTALMFERGDVAFIFTVFGFILLCVRFLP
jgi:hypothetical protein